MEASTSSSGGSDSFQQRFQRALASQGEIVSAPDGVKLLQQTKSPTASDLTAAEHLLDYVNWDGFFNSERQRTAALVGRLLAEKEAVLQNSFTLNDLWTKKSPPVLKLLSPESTCTRLAAFNGAHRKFCKLQAPPSTVARVDMSVESPDPSSC